VAGEVDGSSPNFPSTTLRSGEDWNERLLTLIEEADVFQLFWSWNSMVSDYVRREWEHALHLARDRESFIRPTYWQVPMPTSANPKLPPDDLSGLHFHAFHEWPTGIAPLPASSGPWWVQTRPIEVRPGELPPPPPKISQPGTPPEFPQIQGARPWSGWHAPPSPTPYRGRQAPPQSRSSPGRPVPPAPTRSRGPAIAIALSIAFAVAVAAYVISPYLSGGGALFIGVVAGALARRCYCEREVSGRGDKRFSDLDDLQATNLVNGNRKLISCRQGGFYRRSQHFLDPGGCVVVVSSCEEGAGAASAVGQASAVRGVARTRVEHPRRRS
jgi:TIR domain